MLRADRNETRKGRMEQKHASPMACLPQSAKNVIRSLHEDVQVSHNIDNACEWSHGHKESAWSLMTSLVRFFLLAVMVRRWTLFE